MQEDSDRGIMGVRSLTVWAANGGASLVLSTNILSFMPWYIKAPSVYIENLKQDTTTSRVLLVVCNPIKNGIPH